MTYPADRRITTRHGVLDVVIETHPAGVVARVLRPEEHLAGPRVTAAMGQDEDEAVERLQAALDDDGPIIQLHVVLSGEPEPPADGLPVFRFGRVLRAPEGDAED